MRYLQSLCVMAAGLFVLVAAWPVGADTGAATLTRGRIIDVRPAENQLTIHTPKNGDLKLTVDAQSRISVANQQAVKLSDLRPGMRVRVTYEPKDGSNRVVSITEPLITLGNVQAAANKAFDVTKTYAFQQKDEYQKKLQPMIAHVDEQIADLRDQAADAGAQAKERINREIQDLSQKRAVLQQRLEQLGAANAQSWEDIRNGVNAAVNDVQQAIQRARSDSPTLNPPPQQR